MIDGLVPYLALMVGVKSDETIAYGTVEIIGTELPTNDTECIMGIVDIANTKVTDEDIYYIDMYGFSYLGKRVLWEVSGTEIERIGGKYE